MTDTELPTRKRSRATTRGGSAEPEAEATDGETPTRKRSRAPARGTADAEDASTGDLVAQLGDGAPARPARRSRRRNDEAADAPETPAQLDESGLVDTLPIAPEDDLSEVEGEASVRLVSIVESLLFAANKPLGVRDIRHLLKDASQRQVQLALKQLGRDLQGRGIVLAQVAGGFRLRTEPENSRWVQQLLAEKPARLSRSQLETLAVIAYRQPVTKPEVDHIRGVDCGAVMKILLDHDLVRIVGRKEEPGRPHLYGTTLKFLEFFNLRSLRDMPDLHEFRELTEESRQLVAEQLGDGALFDERETMGQEVLDWGGTDGERTAESDDGEQDQAQRHAADDTDKGNERRARARAGGESGDDGANVEGSDGAGSTGDDDGEWDDDAAGEGDESDDGASDDDGADDGASDDEADDGASNDGEANDGASDDEADDGSDDEADDGSDDEAGAKPRGG